MLRSAALVLAMMICACSWAEDAEKPKASESPNFQYHTVTTKEGLNFRVPEDMPIENRDGIQRPMPFDEYMYAKLKQVETKLEKIEKRMAAAESSLLSLEKRQKRPLKS